MMSCRAVAVLFCSAVPLALHAGDALAAPAPDDPAILGGRTVDVGEFPTVVAIVNRGLCTGTLIHPEWILTAAHCISPSVLGVANQQAVTNSTTVVFDSVNAASGGRRIDAVATIPHASFSINGLGDNDIGLIQLAEPVTDRPVSRINRVSTAVGAGDNVTMVGYGKTSSGSFGRLYAIDAKPLISCAQVGGNNATLLCFNQTDGTGKCQGDSGGPSFLDIDGVQTLVGVTSFGDEDCQVYGADTRVDSELTFIDGMLGDALACVQDGECNAGCSEDLDCPRCESDDACGTDEVCDAGFCVSAPFTPGGAGAPCTADSDCDSRVCGSDGVDSLCVEGCADDSACPDDFACLTASGGGGVCWPNPGAGEGSGGCSTSGGGASWSLLALGTLLALGRRRRRSHAG